MLSAASLTVVLCLWTGQGFYIFSSIDNFRDATERRFANSSQREVALASLEMHSRVRSKAPRRHVQVGALPLNRATDIPDVSVGLLHAEARYKTLLTRSLPNDRAPPASTS